MLKTYFRLFSENNMRKKIWVSWPVIFIFVLMWFIAASILLDFWPLVRSEGEWKTITNTQYGFSVDYPTKWTARVYDEHGFKGEDEVKLLIYRSSVGIFEISIEHQAMPDPTLEDVISWSQAQINNSVDTLNSLGKLSNYALITSEEENIRGHNVLRQRYTLAGAMFESVYIARTNDMIIITLQADESEFDSYLEDFDAIVASFRPFE